MPQSSSSPRRCNVCRPTPCPGIGRRRVRRPAPASDACVPLLGRSGRSVPSAPATLRQTPVVSAQVDCLRGVQMPVGSRPHGTLHTESPLPASAGGMARVPARGLHAGAGRVQSRSLFFCPALYGQPGPARMVAKRALGDAVRYRRANRPTRRHPGANPRYVASAHQQGISPSPCPQSAHERP